MAGLTPDSLFPLNPDPQLWLRSFRVGAGRVRVGTRWTQAASRTADPVPQPPWPSSPSPIPIPHGTSAGQRR